MKKFVLIVLGVILSAAVYSQRGIRVSGEMPAIGNPKAVTDTLWPGNALTASAYQLIADSNGGFVLGTNSYGDICKGQVFRVDSGYIVEGAIFWFGAKTVNANDSIRFVLWKLDSLEGITTAGSHQPSPGTELATRSFSLTDVDTASSLNQAFIMNFSVPVSVYEDYMIGFDMSAFTTDSVGLWSTSNGDGGGLELVWEKWALDSTWRTLQASGWGYPALLDIDALILPVVDMSSVGFSENSALPVQARIFPNPSSGIINLEVMLPESETVLGISILDQSGRRVYQADYTKIAKHKLLTLDLGFLASGSYYCAIRTSLSGIALLFSITE